MSTSIRSKYETYGVEQYYSNCHSEYNNPHLEQIKTLLYNNHHNFPCEKILDLCCGHGEVTTILDSLGYKNIFGCDPFTYQDYTDKTSRNCYPYNFIDIIQGKIEEKFSSVICSFGMHLCHEKQMYSLIWALSCCTKYIIIITPHKRPQLEDICGLKLVHEDFCLTERQKKVRLKMYTFSKKYSSKMRQAFFREKSKA